MFKFHFPFPVLEDDSFSLFVSPRPEGKEEEVITLEEKESAFILKDQLLPSLLWNALLVKGFCFVMKKRRDDEA